MFFYLPNHVFQLAHFMGEIAYTQLNILIKNGIPTEFLQAYSSQSTIVCFSVIFFYHFAPAN